MSKADFSDQFRKVIVRNKRIYLLHLECTVTACMLSE